MTLVPLLATIAVVQSVVCGWLIARVRNLAARINGQPNPASDLIGRLEARVARLEARSVATEEPQTIAPGSSKRQRRLDRRQEAPVDGPVLIAVPSLASIPVGTPSAVAAEFDRRFGPIWTLADAGTPPDEIARQTGHPIGQVELILGLRGSRSTTPAATASRSDHV